MIAPYEVCDLESWKRKEGAKVRCPNKILADIIKSGLVYPNPENPRDIRHLPHFCMYGVFF